jgi:hypothetical protein
MTITPRPTMTFGDLVAIAFDEAFRLTSDPEEAVRIATLAVAELLARRKDEATQPTAH